MATGIYLIDNPPVRSQYRSPRREQPSGVIVVHTAESFPDETGPDTGAENVAAFIQRRTTPGSYHDLADSDSTIRMVRYTDEAFGDATGSNPHAYHVSAATQAAKWGELGEQWVRRCVWNMAAAAAAYAMWLRAAYEIIVPAKRITRAQSENRLPGFISHAERDPARRTDPGVGFPWDDFLNDYQQIMESDMELTDTVRLFTGQGVDYSSPTTDVEHVLASTNLVVFQTRNRVIALAADVGALEAVLAAHVAADPGNALTIEQITAAARDGAAAALAAGIDLRVTVDDQES